MVHAVPCRPVLVGPLRARSKPGTEKRLPVAAALPRGHGQAPAGWVFCQEVADGHREVLGGQWGASVCSPPPGFWGEGGDPLSMGHEANSLERAFQLQQRGRAGLTLQISGGRGRRGRKQNQLTDALCPLCPGPAVPPRVGRPRPLARLRVPRLAVGLVEALRWILSLLLLASSVFVLAVK